MRGGADGYPVHFCKLHEGRYSVASRLLDTGAWLGGVCNNTYLIGDTVDIVIPPSGRIQHFSVHRCPYLCRYRAPLSLSPKPLNPGGRAVRHAVEQLLIRQPSSNSATPMLTFDFKRESWFTHLRRSCMSFIWDNPFEIWDVRCAGST